MNPYAALDEVAAFSGAKAKRSLTSREGGLQHDPVAGVSYRLTRPVAHHHGHLSEIYRTDWDMTDLPIVQVNATTTFPGRVRAWGIHQATVDRLFAMTGSLMVVCFDGRPDSPTKGAFNQFFLGALTQGLVVIPPGVWHGWQNVGPDDATIVSMPSRLYDYEGPDRWELPHDSDQARAQLPDPWV